MYVSHGSAKEAEECQGEIRLKTERNQLQKCQKMDL